MAGCCVADCENQKNLEDGVHCEETPQITDMADKALCNGHESQDSNMNVNIGEDSQAEESQAKRPQLDPSEASNRPQLDPNEVPKRPQQLETNEAPKRPQQLEACAPVDSLTSPTTPTLASSLTSPTSLGSMTSLTSPQDEDEDDAAANQLCKEGISVPAYSYFVILQLQ